MFRTEFVYACNERRLAISNSTWPRRLPLNMMRQVCQGLSVLKSWHFFFSLSSPCFSLSSSLTRSFVEIVTWDPCLFATNSTTVGPERANTERQLIWMWRWRRTVQVVATFVQNTKKQKYRITENAKIQKYRNAKSQKYKRGETGGLDEKMMQRAVRSVAAFVHKWADSISRANMAGNRRIPPTPCQQWKHRHRRNVTSHHSFDYFNFYH